MDTSCQKASLTLPVLLFLFFLPTDSFAIDFHLGLGVGPAVIYVNESDFDDGSLGDTASVDSSAVALTLYGEAEFNRFLRLEFGILDGTLATMDGTSDGSGSYWVSGPVSADYGLGGLKVGAVVSVPLGTDKFKLLFKGGAMLWGSIVTLNDNLSEETETDAGISPYGGVGLEVDLSRLLALRLQFETFNAKADSDYFPDGYDFHYANSTLGVVFRF